MRPSVHDAAARAEDHPVLTAGARLGYAASGVLHLVLGWIAVGLAWGTSSGSADQTGAFQQLGSTPLGAVLLWVVVTGFALLGVAARVALNAGGGGEEQTQSLTAGAMEHPLGVVAVVVVGGGIVCVGVYHVVKGWFRRFLDDLREQPPGPIVVLARVGYVAKGVALGVVGVLFMVAAATNDPEEAGGLDAALRALLELPAGTALLTAVGLGIAAYGVYSFARARYARV